MEPQVGGHRARERQPVCCTAQPQHEQGRGRADNAFLDYILFSMRDYSAHNLQQ